MKYQLQCSDCAVAAELPAYGRQQNATAVLDPEADTLSASRLRIYGQQELERDELGDIRYVLEQLESVCRAAVANAVAVDPS